MGLGDRGIKADGETPFSGHCIVEGKLEFLEGIKTENQC